MKPYIIFLSLLLLSFFTGYSQHTIKLNLKEGYEYVFKKVDRDYILTSEETIVREKKVTKVYKVVVDGVNADNTIDVSLTFHENYREGDPPSGLIDRVDFFYPEFRREKNYMMNGDLKNYLYSNRKFKFNINLSTNKMEITNRVELLESFHDELRNFILEEDDGLIRTINNGIGDVYEELLAFLTWFNNANLTGNALHDSQLDDEFVVREKKGSQLRFGDLDIDKIISGKTYKKYWLGTDNWLITNYSTVKYDSINSELYGFSAYQYRFKVKETNFRLLYSQKVPEHKLFISGKIEHPLGDKLHIQYLEKPFGVDLKTKTIILDENGAFNESFDYKNGGFIYVQNENKNSYKPPGTYVFYAEPGDSIIFNSVGEELPWETTNTGTRANESNFILDLRKNIKSTKTELTSPIANGRSNVILDEELYFRYVRINNKYVRSGGIEPLFESINQIDEIAEKYQSLLSEKSFKYISNEVKSYFYSGIYNISSVSIKGSFYFENISRDSKEEMKKFGTVLNELNLLDFYNDYGLYSRKFATHYLAYHFNKANKIRSRNITSSGTSYTGETELKIQFARLVLTGAPYYREIAATLSDILIQKRRLGKSINRSVFMKDMAVENLNLLIMLCNDEEIVSESKHIVSQHKQLKDKKYLPEMVLLNLEGEKVTLQDYKGDKPTIFYLSSSWSGGRYQFDDLAKENPEYNFVMVLEGKGFEYWKQYTERAEPVAQHLFWFSDTLTFNDLFHKNAVIFILNKNGEFEGYARSNPGAIELAKETLNPKKKELNKGQLQVIIIILVSILTALIIGLTIWKWRVRQRFRKEEQNRKLRELELTAIRSQMNPHFLFNALNSVQNLVQQNKGREAHLYLADFAGLIRKVLNNSEKEEVSLAEELEMTEQYLNLEKLRFDFEFKLSVSEEIDSHNTLVPSMLLQPFVENAVIHGLQNKQGDKQLKIEISKVEQGINISIEDNGIGRTAAKEIAKAKNGKGTKLMKERLEILQEKQCEKYSLEIVDLEVGTRVDIVIPEES